MTEQTQTSEEPMIDPRALLDPDAVEVAARAVAAEIDNDDDWDKDLDDEDRVEVRNAVRTAVVAYLAATARKG